MGSLSTSRSAAAAVEVSSENGAVVLSLAGQLDLSSLDHVRGLTAETLYDKHELIVVDLGELSFMDSSGIAYLLSVADRADRIELRHVPPMIRRVLEITGLTGVLRIVE